MVRATLQEMYEAHGLNFWFEGQRVFPGRPTLRQQTIRERAAEFGAAARFTFLDVNHSQDLVLIGIVTVSREGGCLIAFEDWQPLGLVYRYRPANRLSKFDWLTVAVEQPMELRFVA